MIKLQLRNEVNQGFKWCIEIAAIIWVEKLCNKRWASIQQVTKPTQVVQDTRVSIQRQGQLLQIKLGVRQWSGDFSILLAIAFSILYTQDTWF